MPTRTAQPNTDHRSLTPSSADASSLERARLVTVLATIAINITAVIVFAFLPGSNWRTAFGLNLVDNIILIAHAVRRRDRLMWHLLLFGLIVGFCELPADAWVVRQTGTLDYSPGGGPFIWCSPFWMPLAWQIVAVQLGYLGLRLWEWRGATGLVLTGLLGGSNIPFYEETARLTHWWEYHNCPMLLHTPYYIIAGEFLIAIVFAILARPLRRQQPMRTILMGFVAGLLIGPAYMIPYVIIQHFA
jgi:hypothetical protein